MFLFPPCLCYNYWFLAFSEEVPIFIIPSRISIFFYSDQVPNAFIFFLFFSLFQVTRDVSLLSRWMAIDLYIREVDSLRFELSMNQCNDRLSRLAHEILEKGVGCLAGLCSFQPQNKYSRILWLLYQFDLILC